jgi:hypothetical protein
MTTANLKEICLQVLFFEYRPLESRNRFQFKYL